ncbi:hypothetical protein D3C86_1730740 [compost metagenome]
MRIPHMREPTPRPNVMERVATLRVELMSVLLKKKGNRRPSRGGKFPDGLKRHSWSLGPAVTEWWSQTAALQKMSDEL